MSDLPPVLASDVPDVQVRRSGTTVHVVLNGELDIASGPHLRDEIDQVLSTDPTTFVLDLRGLEFMDSTGFAECYRAITRAEARGMEVAVIRGAPAVQRVFVIAGMDERLPFVDAPLAGDACKPAECS